MTDKTELEEAKDLLMREEAQNICLLSCIKRGSVRDIFISGGSVLLDDAEADAFLLSIHDETGLEKLKDRLPKKPDILFVAQEQFGRELAEMLDFPSVMLCDQYVYPKNEPIPTPPCLMRIAPLSMKHLDFVHKHYSNAAANDRGYLASRIQAGVAFGAFEGNDLCGFILTHGEGSLGMLEVLPEYRGKGIAPALEAAAANEMIRKGLPAFGHVKLGNQASQRVQKKLGFQKCAQSIAWMY